MYLSMIQSCLQCMKGYLIWFTFVFAFTHSYAFASTNVKDSGATGNGSTDDTRAIQAAINASPAGDTIVFPAGTYKVSSTIYIPSNRTVQGQSGATLTGPGGMFLMILPYDSASNIKIDGMVFDSGGISTNGNSVPAYNIQISDCTFQNILTTSANWTTHDAIFVPGGMSSSTIANNRFFNILEGGLTDYVDRTANGIQAWRLNNVAITDNTFDTVNQGISFQFDGTVSNSNVAVLRNTFARVHRMGIETQGSGTQGFLVDSNKFSDFLKPFWNTYGMSIVVDGGYGTVVRNNVIDASTATASVALEVSGINTSVTGNAIRNNFSWGIAIGAATGMSVTGNSLCGSAGALQIGFEGATQLDAQILNNSTSLTCPSALPSATVTAPTANAIVAGKIQLTATASSSAVLTSVTFLLDGGTSVGQDFSSPWTVTWDTTQAANGTHTLQAVAVDSNGESGTSAPVTFSINNGIVVPTPPTAGLRLWLKGDSGLTLKNGNVSRWADQSGSGIVALQSTASLQPSYISGTYKAVRFDGAKTFLSFPLPINGLTGMTVILVAANSVNSYGGPSRSTNAPIFWDETAWWGTTYLSPFQTNVAFRFGTTQTYNWPVYYRPVSIGSALNLAVAIHNGSTTTDSLYVNGVLAYAEGGKYAAISGTVDTGTLGQGYANSYFAGDIAEVLVYNRALTDTERHTAELYLMNKYSLR